MKILDPNGLVDNLYKYVQTNIEIAKVEVQEKIEDTVKKVVLFAILAISGSMFFIFLLITLALFLNEVLNSSYLGFLIITVLLGILSGVVFMMIKPRLEQPQKPEEL
ncbi:MAG: phage holin family protein [Arcicella sp.]|nr:phage holin family protein [Arcicella sp.]